MTRPISGKTSLDDNGFLIITEVRKKCHTFQVLKEKNHQPQILYLTSTSKFCILFFRNVKENDIFRWMKTERICQQQNTEKIMAKGSLWIRKEIIGTSLVAEWLRIRLPMQRTGVRALVREDPTCRGATKPVHRNYWAWALEPTCHNYWSPCTQSPWSATREATSVRSLCTATKSSPSSPQLEKARA